MMNDRTPNDDFLFPDRLTLEEQFDINILAYIARNPDVINRMNPELKLKKIERRKGKNC